jgi:hypothetical protein
MQAKKEFNINDYTYSATSIHKLIDNIPSPIHVYNLKQLHENVTLKLLEILPNKTIVITSGFRSINLNRAIGGSSLSQHCNGQAIDIQVEGVSVENVFNTIRNSSILYDQLIQEFDSWIHISFAKNKNRNQDLRAIKEKGKTKYIKI